MLLTITNFALLSLYAIHLASCGTSLSTKQLLVIDMYGVSKAVSTATGDQDPNELTYQLLLVNLISADGATKTTLFDNEEDRIYKIIDRQQTIFSKKISDLVSNTYSGIQISFLPNVTGGNSAHAELGFTMAQPILSLSQNILIEKSKSIEMLIKLNWGNTISEGGITEPEYELSIP